MFFKKFLIFLKKLLFIFVSYLINSKFTLFVNNLPINFFYKSQNI